MSSAHGNATHPQAPTFHDRLLLVRLAGLCLTVWMLQWAISWIIWFMSCVIISSPTRLGGWIDGGIGTIRKSVESFDGQTWYLAVVYLVVFVSGVWMLAAPRRWVKFLPREVSP